MADEKSCSFCDPEQMWPRIVLDGQYWFVVLDNSPVNNGHALIILKRHHLNIFDLSRAEWKDLQDIIEHTIIPRYNGDVENPRGGIRNFKKPLVAY